MDYLKNSVDVELRLVEGTILRGKVNMLNHDRFSDFIDRHPQDHIKLYDVCLGESRIEFLIVPKSKVLFYIPI